MGDLSLGPDPEKQAAEGSGTGSFVTDPMDLFGKRAKYDALKIKEILMQSAREGIAAQKEMMGKMDKMFKPFYEAGLQSFGELSTMAMGGEMPADYQPSKLYEFQKKEGERGIKTGAAKSGLLHSSATEQKKADLTSGLASEEAQRLYGGMLSSVQLGTNSADAINASSRSLGGNVSSIYGNLGASLNTNLQQYGAARQTAFEGLSSTLGNIGTYTESQ